MLFTSLLLFESHKKNQNEFNIANVIQGNWSRINSDKPLVLFFIRIQNYSHLQALLYDKFFDVYIHSPFKCTVFYQNFSANLQFTKVNQKHYISFSNISSDFNLDIEFQYSRWCVIRFINIKKQSIIPIYFEKDFGYPLTRNIVLKMMAHAILLFGSGFLFSWSMKHRKELKRKFSIPNHD